MDWQKYLPWIIGGAIVLYIFTKMRSRTVLAPQTQITETPQTDPYLEARSGAFGSLVELAGNIAAQDTVKSIGLAREDTAKTLGLAKEETARFATSTGLTIANRSFDTQISLANIYAQVQNYAANLNILNRNQDRQIQQSAIDRYYSSRNLESIAGSISTALGSIFGNRSGSGSIFRGTPPTFPGFTF